MREKNYYVTLVIVLAFMLSFVFLQNFTARLISGGVISANISQRSDGRIFFAVANTSVQVYDTQSFAVIFKNSGSMEYSASITLKVYKASGNNLNLTAAYADSSSLMPPGATKTYSTIYVANETGLYYAQARAVYGTRTAETWGAFFVISPPPAQPAPPAPPPQPQTIVLTGGGGVGTGTGNGTGSGTGDVSVFVTTLPTYYGYLELKNPDTVNISTGDTTLVDIHVTNTGQRNLTNLRLYVSAPSSISVDVNPKVISELGQNRTAIFLISVVAGEDVAGMQDIYYEAVSDFASVSGSIRINVTKGFDPTDIMNRILNYQVLVLQIKDEIYAAQQRGFDVKDPLDYIGRAQNDIEDARKYAQVADYLPAKRSLDSAKDYIEQAVFTLAVVTFVVHAEPSVSLYLILPFVAAAVVLFMLYRLAQRKGEKRPKLLREASEES